MTITHNFDTEKFEEKKIDWKNRRITGLAVFSIVALIVIEIWVSHTVANFGEQFKSIETIKTSISSENKILENEIAKYSSISRIASQSATLGFISTKNIKYIQ